MIYAILSYGNLWMFFTYLCAQFAAISLGTRCPPREQRLLVSCSPPPHQVIPEGPLEGQGRENFLHEILFKKSLIRIFFVYLHKR